MYTDTMNIDELIEEFKTDLPQVIAISNAKQAQADKLIKRSQIYPVYLYAVVTSRKGNKWIILFEAKSKKNIGNNCLMTMVSIVEKTNGRYAIMYSSAMGQPQFILFTPHFFQRFAKRTGVPGTGIPLIQRFFKINPSYGLTYRQEEDTTNIYGSTTEGVALGIKPPHTRNNVILFRTFISYAMCKGSQIEEFAKSDQLRKEIHEEEISLKY